MRIDKFLNSVNITKRRSVAQDMIANKVVLINDAIVKSSKNVEVGNVIVITILKVPKNTKCSKFQPPNQLQNLYKTSI